MDSAISVIIASYNRPELLRMLNKGMSSSVGQASASSSRM